MTTRQRGSTGARPWLLAAALAGMPCCAKPRPEPPGAEPAAAARDDGSPRVATDGRGRWVVVWHSSDTRGGRIGDDFDILVSRSLDGGRTWSARAPLNTNAATDSGHDFRPHLATDGAGHWVAVWESEDTLGGTVGPDADIFVSRSTDAGATWTSPVPLGRRAAVDVGDDGRPQVVTDGSGRWLVVWHDGDPTGGAGGRDTDILVSRSSDAGVTWSEPAALNTDAESDARADGFPRVATDGQDRWVAVWSGEDLAGGPHGQDADIFVARSSDHGRTWTAPVPLAANARSDVGSDMYPQLAADGHGRWLAVWQSYDSLGGRIGEDADLLVSRSTDGGVSWTAPAPLHGRATEDTDYDLHPAITTDGRGRWVVVWVLDDSWGERRGTDVDLRVSRSTDGGATWSAPLPLDPGAATDTVSDEAPDVATDAAGRWIAVWQAGDTWKDTAATTFHVALARSTDGGASWRAAGLSRPRRFRSRRNE